MIRGLFYVIRGSFWGLLTLVIVFVVVGKIAEVVSFQHGSTRTVIGTVAGALGVLAYLLIWRRLWRREMEEIASEAASTAYYAARRERDEEGKTE